MKMLTIPYLKMIEHGHHHLFWMDLLWEALMYKVLCSGKENRNVHCSVWRSCYPSAWWPGLKNLIVELIYYSCWCLMRYVLCYTFWRCYTVPELINIFSLWSTQATFTSTPNILIWSNSSWFLWNIHLRMDVSYEIFLYIICSSVYGLGFLLLKSYLTRDVWDAGIGPLHTKKTGNSRGQSVYWLFSAEETIAWFAPLSSEHMEVKVSAWWPWTEATPRAFCMQATSSSGFPAGSNGIWIGV